jgi:hypothetical protein
MGAGFPSTGEHPARRVHHGNYPFGQAACENRRAEPARRQE